MQDLHDPTQKSGVEVRNRKPSQSLEASPHRVSAKPRNGNHIGQWWMVGSTLCTHVGGVCQCKQIMCNPLLQYPIGLSIIHNNRANIMEEQRFVVR